MGRINGYKVIGLKKDAEKIWYIVGRSPSFREGELVDLEIDWNRRYLMMRLHSVLQLYASVFEAKFNERTAARVVKSGRTYLVSKHELPNEIMDEALKEANKQLQTGLDIQSYEDEVRQGFKWSSIRDYASISCQGLHVKNTREIGPLICTERMVEDQKHKLTIRVQ